jgi:uncharacterized membrane protein
MNLESFSVIVVIAVAAYLMRCSGVWLIRRTNDVSRLLPALQEFPGIILTAAVAPAFLDAGAAGILSLVVTGLLAARKTSLSFSSMCGFLLFLLLRSML